MIDVELTSEVLDTLRAMKDRGTPLPRCHKGPIRSAIAGAVGRLVENSGGVVLNGRDDSATLTEG